MSKLKEALRAAAKRVEAELEESKLFSHPGEIGTSREQIIRSFLRPHLPDFYSIGTGQIFDSNDQMSRQIDVILYDQLFSTALFKEKSSLLLAYESVYGTIEVKSTLNDATLKEACENIASVRALSRAESNITFVLPHYGATVSQAPGNLLQYDKRKANPPLNIIFAYDGLIAETCLQKLTARLRADNKSLLPDFIFNLKRGYMITKSQQKPDGKWIALREFRGEEQFDGYLILNTGVDTLAMFYLTVNAFLDKIRLNAVSMTEHWNDMFAEYKNN